MNSTLDPGLVKERAVRIAFELGAGAVRVAPALRDDFTRRAMEESFARGDLSTWAYDGAYARRASDPRELLAGARSVICVAMPYATEEERDGRPLCGRVSNYAWSADYHAEMQRLLRAVADSIDEAAGEAVTAVACDTRPLAERAFAARAGLGWIGKHTNLIAPGLGSFIFLGEIVTSLVLPPDAAVRKSCGSCTRCVETCPTGALRGDYTIDAKRCISDLTQRTGTIPPEMRALVGDWIWGCDLCQVVCPPTRNAPQAQSARWAPRDARAARPSLVELLQLKSGEFERRYRRSAMGWRGAAVLRRNAAVALGNALDRSTVAALIESLERDPNAMVRGHAAWALGRIGSPRALEALRQRQPRELDRVAREEIFSALEAFE